MLKRSLIIALAMLVVYNVCLLSPRLRSLYSVQSQWQNNLITAQKYVQADPTPEVVLVGSSLAAQLPKKALEPHVYNLALTGGSLFTGLELIEATKSKPKLVVIEINVVWRKVDQPIIDNVSRPGFAWLRGFAPAFQEEYQPANILAGRLTRASVERFSNVKDYLPHKANMKQDDEMFRRMLNIALEKGSTPIEPALLSQQIAALHEHVDRLQNQGTRCVFLRMPVDPALAASRRSSGIRAKMLEEFPPGKFQWITPEQNHIYITTDGQHLQAPDADAYARHVSRTLEQNKEWPVMRSASIAR